MRLEPLARLIESADFQSFREIALKVLRFKGYKEVTLTDGWSDGGTDFRVCQLPPKLNKIGIQITVQRRDWKGKLKQDAAKVKNDLGLKNLVFITSHRIAEAEFNDAADSIWDAYEVRVSKIDNQAIASLFFDQGKASEILSILGIDVPSQIAAVENISAIAQLDAAYSFIFFGSEPARFRERMIESALRTLASSYPNDISKEDLINGSREILHLPLAQRNLVAGALDRMIQRSDFTVEGETIRLSPNIKDAATVAKALKEAELKKLRDKIEEALRKLSGLHEIPEDILDAILEDVGGLIISTADMAFQSLERNEKRGVAQDNIKERLRHLHASLDAMTFPEGKIREDALKQITQITSSSPIGKHIAAGELYLALSAVSTPQLIRALGGRAKIQVILDASVAIPILCSLLYEPASKQRYFVAASHAYKQIKDSGIEILIPKVYLEEVAAHLFLAYENYSSIADIEPDLIASENAFVAHYVAIKAQKNDLSLGRYLSAYGLNERLQKADLYTARNALMPELERLLRKYFISTVDLRWKNQNSRKIAEEMVARATDAMFLRRQAIVLKHDVHTMAALSEKCLELNASLVVCTWDRLHFWVLEHEKPEWDVMDPSVLGDILTLVSTEADNSPLLSVTFLAQTITDETAQEGAMVLDALARIEKGNLYDAELLEKAREFKRTYLTQKKQGIGQESLENAWLEWKARYAY